MVMGRVHEDVKRREIGKGQEKGVGKGSRGYFKEPLCIL